jgi:hypothetical protein
MAMPAQFCGYYAVFVALMVVFAVLIVGALRRRWTDGGYRTAVAVAAGVSGSRSGVRVRGTRRAGVLGVVRPCRRSGQRALQGSPCVFLSSRAEPIRHRRDVRPVRADRDRVRYAVFHLDLFDPPARSDVLSRLAAFDRYLVRRYSDDRIWLYEIVGFPR